MRLMIAAVASAGLVSSALHGLNGEVLSGDRPSLRAVSTAISQAGFSTGAQSAAPRPSTKSAVCGPNDRPETDIQGRTPLTDMTSGRSQDPYFCGLKEIGGTDLGDRGANWQLARSGTCAYVSSISTLFAATNVPAGTGLEGVAIIDVRDSTNPEPVGLLRESAAVDAVETLAAVDAPGRHVLVAGDYSNGQPGDGDTLAIYDTSQCTTPVLQAEMKLPWGVHDLAIASSGRRIYAYVPNHGVAVIDIADLGSPKIIGAFSLALPDGQLADCHTPTLSGNEKLLFCPSTIMSNAAKPSERHTGLFATSGPTIWRINQNDLASENQPFKFIGESRVGGQGWHHIALARVEGKRYVVAANELALGDQGVECDATAFPRIWRLGPDFQLSKVGQFRLEVQDHCADDTVEVENTLGNYASHYNTVVPYRGAALGLFSYLGAGLRVVDLSDPSNPREIAYYKPGADPATALQPAGAHAARLYYDPTVTDACGSRNVFIAERREVWFVCQSTGFHVAQISREALAHVGR